MRFLLIAILVVEMGEIEVVKHVAVVKVFKGLHAHRFQEKAFVAAAGEDLHSDKAIAAGLVAVSFPINL